MKALRKTVAGAGNVELQEVPIPEIGSEDLLLKVSFCGLCGSDLHIEDDLHPYTPPVTIGHEFSGVVEAVGSNVDGFAPGDPVAFRCGWSPYPGVGSDGGFAEFMRAPAASMWKTPEGVTQESASQLETVITPMRLVRDEAKVTPDDRVVVSGVGAIGLITIALAGLAGAQVVALGTESDASLRFPLAEKMGAGETLVFGDETLNRIHAWEPTRWIDASGAAPAIEAAVAHVAQRGTVVIAGMGKGPWNVDLRRLTMDNIALRGVWGGNVDYIPEAAALMARGDLDLSPLFTTMPLSDWRDAFAAMRKQQVVKVLLDPFANAKGNEV
jgi:L-iditol 2-dehydrogenase